MTPALFLAASAAFPSEIEITPENSVLPYEWDTLRIEADPEAPAMHVLTYRNSPAQSSRAGVFTVQIGEVVVDVEIIIGGAARGAELIAVMPRGPFMAVPPEMALQDGDTGSVRIMPAMF